MQYDKALKLAQRDHGLQVMDFFGKFVSDDAVKDVFWMLPSDAVHLMQTMKKQKLETKMPTAADGPTTE